MGKVDTNDSKNRLQVLDALRGVAAVAVALFHFTNEMPPSILTEICAWGWLGVEVFFVISGFVIPYALARSSYQAPQHYGTFLLKRSARLLPPYLGSVLLVIVLWHLSALVPSFQGSAPDYTSGQVALHATLLNGILGVGWLLPVYWTLAIELQYYFLAGMVTPALIASPSKRYAVIIALLAASLLPVSKIWILPYLPLFVLGILAFLHNRHKVSRVEFAIGCAAASLCCVWSLSWQQALAGILTAFAIAFARFPIPKVMLWFGTISYSLYLLHVPIGGRVINLAGRLGLDHVPAQIVAVGAAFAVSTLSAWIWFRVLEAPSQKLSSAIKYKSPKPCP